MEKAVSTAVFVLCPGREPRRLERIRSDLGRVCGVFVIDIDLATGSVRIECKDDPVTHAALGKAIRGLGAEPQFQTQSSSQSDIKRTTPRH